MTTQRQPKRQPKQLMHFEPDMSRDCKLHKPDRVIVRELLFKRKSKSSAKVESKKE